MSAHEPAVLEPPVSPDAYDETYDRGTWAGPHRALYGWLARHRLTTRPLGAAARFATAERPVEPS